MWRAQAPREREDAPGVALVHALPLGWPVRGEPELAGGGVEGKRRRERDWVRFRALGPQLEGGEASGVVGWSNARLWWPVRTSYISPAMADGGRRKREGKPRDGGALGVLIGQRAPGQGEWCLGKAGLVRGDSTAGGRSEQSASCMAGRRGSSGVPQGRVSSWGDAKGQARWRWRGSPGPFGRGRAVDEVHRRRTAGGRRNRAPGGERWR